MFHVVRPVAKKWIFFLCLVAVVPNNWKLYNWHPWKPEFYSVQRNARKYLLCIERN
jgi:hypothetical protein